MGADVDFDQHIDRRARRSHRRGQRTDIGAVVDQHAEACAARASDARRASFGPPTISLVTSTSVTPAATKRLGLTDFLATDADRARGDLTSWHMSGHLWLLACGRSRTPRSSIAAAIAATLRSSASSSTISAGVSTSSRVRRRSWEPNPERPGVESLRIDQALSATGSAASTSCAKIGDARRLAQERHRPAGFIPVPSNRKATIRAMRAISRTGRRVAAAACRIVNGGNRHADAGITATRSLDNDFAFQA